MNRPKPTSTISPNILVKGGLFVYECKLCKRVFQSLPSVSVHTTAIHRLKMIVKHNYRRKRHDDDDDDDDDDQEDSDSDSDSDRYEQVDEDETDESDEDNVVEEGKEAWMTDRVLVKACRWFAESALEYFNNKDGGKKYEFVQQGPNVATVHNFRHINFKAKEKDCPEAPVETFFAQMRFGSDDRIDCCVSLGPCNELPHWSKPILGGCKLCHGLVHHPLGMVDNLRLE